MMANRPEKGFTLIETLVALLIISISLLALGAFTIQVLSTDSVAIQRTVATQFGERILETWTSTGTTPGNPTTDTRNNVDYSLVPSTSTTGIPAGVNRVVTVSWSNKGTSRQVVLSAMSPAP
ncbi:MAG: prepilin-type N-terminal cleavage/methylation domain-containing protein [Mariprofundaceae bacterium]